MKKKITKEGKFYDENGKHVDSIFTEFESDKFTKTDLKHRGWKDDLIKELLGQPDEEEPTVHGNMMKFYKIERVLKAEDTDTFRSKKVKRRKKKH